MTIQSLQNPANILATPVPASGAQPSPANSTEPTFKQVLQREVTERRSGEPASRPESSEADASSGSASSAQAPDQTGKPVSEADRQSQEEATAEENQDLEDAAAVSAELLALVANMTQLASSANARGNAKNPEMQAGIQIEADAAPASGKQTLAELDALQHSTNAADKDVPLQAAEHMLAAKAGKADAIAERTQLPAALQPGASPTVGAASFAANGPAEQAVSGLDGSSLSSPAQVMLPMQQATNRLNGASMAAPEALAPQVGTPAWDQAVGQKVVWMVSGAQQSASLTLNPPELGPMQIVLNVSNSQANATFVAAQPEVRQALEATLPRLREMLEGAGIQLGQTNINAGTPNQGGQFEQNGKPSSSHFGRDQQGDQPATVVRQQAIRQGLGMVDTFA